MLVTMKTQHQFSFSKRILLPCSAYSTLLIQHCWNDPQMDSTEPPIQAEWNFSAGSIVDVTILSYKSRFKYTKKRVMSRPYEYISPTRTCTLNAISDGFLLPPTPP